MELVVLRLCFDVGSIYCRERNKK